MKRIFTIVCLFSAFFLKAQTNQQDALQILLNKNLIKSDLNVDFIDHSKKIELPEDGMFIYSSLNNNGNYSLGYDSDENYVVTISNPAKQKIRIRTDYIALAEAGDILRFFDGPDTLHPLMASYSGFLFQNELIVSHSNVITISFKSNSSAVSRGFRLRVDQANLKGYALSTPQSCLNSTPAADACVNAPLICNLNGYCGNTSGQYTPDNTNIPGFCGSIENNSWLSFIASSPSAQFEFISAGCQSTSSGIQALIYASSNCSNFTQVSNCVSQGSSSGSFTITTNTPLVIGTKYYIMVDGYGGNVCNYSVTAQSGVATNPQITANPTQICPGSSTQMGSSIASTSYSWTASDGTPLPNTATITVSPTVTTTYTLEVGPSGCSPTGGSAVQTITVSNILPPPSISAPSGGCSGNSVAFSSLTNGGTYSWTGPNGFASALQNPSINNFTTNDAGTYTLIISYGPGCATMPGTINLNVLPSPTVNISVAPSSAVCAGNPVVLTASGGTGANPYNWNWNSAQATGTVQTCLANPLWISPIFEPITGPQFLCTDNPFPGSSAGSTATVIPNQNTQVCVSTTGANGCIATACQNITVLSNTALNTSPSVTTCPSQSVTLTGYGASSYTWAPSASLNSANGTTVSANPAVTTIYTVTGTGCGGAALSNTVEVSVNSTPPVIGPIQTQTLVCPNQTDVLFTVNNLAGTDYSWTLPTGAVITSTSSTSNDVTANIGSSTGTFTVAVTATNTCGSTTETLTIDVTQITVTASGNPTSYCSPGSSTLTVSGAYWYDIQPTNGLATSSGTMTTFVASPTVTTNYTITGTQGACVNNTVVTITVGSGGSVLNVSSSATSCPTGTVTLTASGVGNYTWSPSSSIIGSVNSASILVNPSITTTYSVTGQGCSGPVSNTVEVVVVNSISVSASASPTLLCSGSSATLTASGASTYTWLPASNLSAGNGSVTIATPSSSETYTVTGLTGNCTNTAVVTISVSSSPVYTVTSNPASICIGQNAVLTASAGGVSSYTWNTGASQNPLTVSPSTTTSYTVTGNSNCPGQGVVTVTVNQLPIININSGTICANNSITLTASGTANSYTWSTGSLQNTVTVTPSSTTIYSVTGATSSGCTGTQTTIVNVNNPVASFSGMSNSTEVIGTTLSLHNTSTGASSFAWETCHDGVSTASVVSLPLFELETCCVKLYAFDGLCVDSTEKCVTVIPLARLIIPNVFTPNGDGSNDVFTLDAIGMGEISISIFDRWGLKMFETSAIGNIKWDGKNKGGAFVSDGTYFYMLKATGLDGETYDQKGTINVFK